MGAPPVADEATGASGRGLCATQAFAPRRTQGTATGPLPPLPLRIYAPNGAGEHKPSPGGRWPEGPDEGLYLPLHKGGFCSVSHVRLQKSIPIITFSDNS